MASARSNKTLQATLVVLITIVALMAVYFILTYQKAPPAVTTPGAPTTVRLATWNLYNFGRSKDDRELAFIAAQVRAYDLVAIQEVSTGQAGPEAVARLDAVLDATGTPWAYTVSTPTTGDGPERYAYLWKPARVHLVGEAWLAAELADLVDREPFLARFETADGQRRMLLASFHAVPTSKNPATEIRLLDRLHTAYPDDHLLIMGDFNLSEESSAFDGLKNAGYAPVLTDQKTSIKIRRKDDEHLANEYDNIFYETTPLRALDFGVIDFTDAFGTLREARRISDHLPVYVEVIWN